jgi:putative membrane protein insertion efficiency factor
MGALLVTLLFTQPPYETNPAKLVLDSGFRLYQTFISPAQGDVCNFSPSCSHFAQESTDKYGILWGTFMASDRLLRCNPWAYESFDKHYMGIRNHKIYDPVENNYIFGAINKPRPLPANRPAPYY